MSTQLSHLYSTPVILLSFTAPSGEQTNDLPPTPMWLLASATVYFPPSSLRCLRFGKQRHN